MAYNIIKGEQSGDEFLWDATCYDPASGTMITGVWKSFKEANGKVVVAEE
jgi:hypothetical protein